MSVIFLVPTTAAGDDLAYLPLRDFALAAAGAEGGSAIPSQMRSQLLVLQELIYFILDEEGLTPVEDEIGLRLTISEMLAFAEDGAPVELRVVVRTA